MKKRIALLSIILLGMTILLACRKVEDKAETKAEVNAVSVGGWDTSENAEITNELKDIFEKSTETITGVKYTPVAYLGSQIVAGKNYAFLCRSEPSVEELNGKTEWEIVYVYQDLKGDCSVISSKVIDIYPE